ncbi:NAD-dependent epimerase/dehydratase family protein [Streptomyces sp. ISL-96]|uniref:NAD-dependent epimerase/dehydratase family protein n=1 Tax=Streptomyces sp. ISL-96 TaxID=2819191 RepID=UPI001BEA7977|nr:NAD-dependent epimerase/dehydratase family protein [Streptomyces sp. ISL-96]MBT2493436.1 NAD-dependent epimerase/dehydratase family protein [Streptomyces sp. ISL-96]
MKPTRVVMTGATGFIGSAVLGELTRYRNDRGESQGNDLCLRVLGRRPPDSAAAQADQWVQADLTQPDALRGVCEDADVLLHMAALVSSDASQCEAVNVRGTAALMNEAARAGVSRIVHLSTAAVYGPGPHRGIAVNEVAPSPVSAASRSRLAGEAHALAAGAVVLRPGLVLGRGDRWVVPALAELLEAVPALWDGGKGQLSVVAVDDLARLVACLALVSPLPGGVHHASHPVPVSTGELLRTLAQHRVLPRLPSPLPWDQCLTLLRSAHTRVSERQFALLVRDHWYESREVWRIAKCSPGPGPLVRLAEAAPWYRSILAARPEA